MIETTIKKLRSISGIMWGALALIIFFMIFANGYLSVVNFMNIFRNMSVLLIVSIGMTMAILSGQIDMSVGGILTISAMLTAMYIKPIENPSVMQLIIACLIGIATGTAFGFFNGFMIGYMKYNYWLITFASMNMGFGLAQAVTGGKIVAGFSSAFRTIGGGSVGGISTCIILSMMIAAMMLFVLYRTRFGMHIYAVGDSEQCSVNSGIDVAKIRFQLYTLSGLMAGIASVILISRTNSASAMVGEGYEFNAIAAVVIGGTAMDGGKGGFKGTILGAFFITAMKSGLQLIGLSNYWQQSFIGVIIMIIIVYDVLSGKHKLKKSMRRLYIDHEKE